MVLFAAAARRVSTTMNSSLLSSTDPAGGHPVPLAGWQTAKASVRSEGSLRSGGLARSVNIAGPALLVAPTIVP